MLNATAIITFLSTLILTIGVIWLGTNANFLPEVASLNAPVYDELFKVLFIIGGILFVGMTGFLVYSLIRFRRRPGQTGDGLSIEGNLPLEIFWTAIPAIVIMFVGLYSYDIYERMGGMQSLGNEGHSHHLMTDEVKLWGGIGNNNSNAIFSKQEPSSPLPIELSAMQFAFIFHYPQGDIISGELHIPIGKPVSMKMESNDVIHAFWVPQFRLKQDIIPGQPTILNFTPTKVGSFPIICAELCGPYHGGMRSNVIVENIEDYENWFNKNSKKVSI